MASRGRKWSMEKSKSAPSTADENVTLILTRTEVSQILAVLKHTEGVVDLVEGQRAEQIFSLTGVQPTQLPASVWRWFDRRSADLQDLLLNEPWFFIEGLLWAALGVAIVRPSARRIWLLTAVIACVLLTVVGVLSGLGIIGSFHLG